MTELELTKGPVHFIGIGGIGMSGIARILLQIGFPVFGSDIKESDTVKNLKKSGARVFIGHAAENITENIKTVVFSSAVSQDNPELLKAKKLGINVIPRAEMLARLMTRQKSIAVAGAHGKTTTSAMISLMLELNNCDPTVIIGGELKQIGSNAKLGKGKYLVAEADESDGTFLLLSPHIAVITNIENDHLDYYRSVNNIVSAFVRFVKQLPEDGLAVISLDNKQLADIRDTVPGRYITYAVNHEGADYTVKNISFKGMQSRCEVFYRGSKLGELKLQVPGLHNISNALAAISVGREIGLTFHQVVLGLKEFSGAKRRFEFISKTNGITIVDDYAHHPTELQATLKAAKNAGFSRIIAVFQPHRYSRTKLLQFEFGDSFHDADLIIIDEIYSASEKPITGVTSGLIVNAIRNCSDKEVQYFKTENEIVDFLAREARSGDLVLTLGAGNIRRVGIRLAEELRLLGGNIVES
jgi:UDP-N-acetylmuramate--alanine ligase